MIGIHHRAALKRADGAHDFDASALAIRHDLSAGGEKRTFLSASGETKSMALDSFVRAPAKGLSRGFEDGAQSRLF